MNRFCVLIVLGGWALAQSTNPTVPSRTETITITDAPTAKDQIRQEVDGKIRKSVELATKGETTEALKLLDEAYETTTQQAFLGYLQGTIFAYKGQIYLLRRESDKAISAFVRRLDFNKDDCSRAIADGLPYSQTCADAHKELANALLSASKYEDCLEHALIAAEDYQLSTRDGQPATEAARQGTRTEFSEALLIAGGANLGNNILD